MHSDETAKIAFVISGLTTGGAEMMLLKLLSRLDRRKFAPIVFSLTDLVPLKDRFCGIGIPVETMGMPRGMPDPRGVFRLCSRLRDIRPHLVQTWMYHSDLIGGIAAAMAGRVPVIWNIRHSDLNPAADKRTTRLTAKICALLSKTIPHRIVCCAESARDLHVALGYAAEKFEVIPNGFDLSAFRPDGEARSRIRRELALPPDALVIGLAARFHPQKDHRGFVQSAALMARRSPRARFLLCGDGINRENRELCGWIAATGVPDRFFLLGRRSDMPTVTAAFDIACSASASGEAFSNTLGEAMACGVPCAATAVGDASQIVGDTGRIVPPRNPEAMSAAWEELETMGAEERQRLGERARQRVLEKFSLEHITAQYETLYQQLLTPEGAGYGRAQWRAS